MKKRNKNKGFTLIELLVMISITGLLSSIIFASVNEGRTRARDARRLADMRQLRTALNLYLSIYGHYPQEDYSSGECNGGWDSTSDGDFIPELRLAGLLQKDLMDPSINNNNSNCGNYEYIQYEPGDYGCNPARGRFYVIQIVDMESIPSFPGAGGQPHPDSPGFHCPQRNWKEWAQYSFGEFEK